MIDYIEDPTGGKRGAPLALPNLPAPRVLGPWLGPRYWRRPAARDAELRLNAEK